MTPTQWEVETEGSLGFSGFQPSSGFSERPCLNSGNYVESEREALLLWLPNTFINTSRHS